MFAGAGAGVGNETGEMFSGNGRPVEGGGEGDGESYESPDFEGQGVTSVRPFGGLKLRGVMIRIVRSHKGERVFFFATEGG